MGGDGVPGHCPVLKEAGGDWGIRAGAHGRTVMREAIGAPATQAQHSHTHPHVTTAHTPPLRTQHRALRFSLWHTRPL